jgi:hypothetical protein
VGLNQINARLRCHSSTLWQVRSARSFAISRR